MSVVTPVENWRECVSPVILVTFAAASALASAQELEISQVALTVNDRASTKPTSGNLYRAHNGRRELVAEISESGKPDRPVKCGTTDKFEAQAESAFDRPLAPVQLQCSKTLRFAFTRMFTLSFPLDQATQLASTESEPLVYGSYADIFAKAGIVVGAKSWDEAATVAAAKTLGDKNLDRFVYRDAATGFSLRFTQQGTEALRQKQVGWGIAATGMLDKKTQVALAKMQPKASYLSEQPALRCNKTAFSTYACEPHKGATSANTPTTVFLPRVPLD